MQDRPEDIKSWWLRISFETVKENMDVQKEMQDFEKSQLS